ncbi:hydroxymethylbilane synthase [Cloacibacillus sp. An23]|uniref:hydroxymethylbilane synthase n=1 Tax=Cloacibacillus sp. An23 TaxID=1965591 RepID=UPI000B399592|nr:hydroxymethylbilane synthase [Cloacibacillus sp. An23]OUO94438.1 hydroxymethylbilane synthase [Cloacibacillus sp. An23]
MTRVIRFGSRKSALALAQTRLVMEAVEAANPDLRAELVPMTTTGDVNMKPFSEASDKFGIKGLFTQELEDALRSGEIDVAVHSLKDVPMYPNDELPIVAYSKREDARDALVLPGGVAEISEALPLGCSSARRRLQLAKLFPNMRVEPVRGNVNTRLRKLDEGQFSALVLAAAGLKRIGLDGRISRYFTVDEIIPAPGQGIMACQGRAGESCDYLDAVRCSDAAFCALAERGFSAELGGGCTAPVGAYAEIKEGKMTLRGFYADEANGIYAKGSVSGLPEEAEEMARALARRLKEGK